MAEKDLYFLAIVPPADISKELLDLKHYFKEEFGSKASLNSEPHITLHMPFRWREDRFDLLNKVLANLGETHSPFTVQLDDFGAFTPRVIYVGVDQTKSLMDFQKKVQSVFRTQLKLMNANHKQRAYHPHITLAFRDLKKPQFFKAWDEFKHKTYSASFLVESFQLLKHNGKKWEIFKDYNLSG